MSNEDKMRRNCSKNVGLFYYSFDHSAGNSRSECHKTQFPAPLNTPCNTFGKVCVNYHARFNIFFCLLEHAIVYPH